MRIAKIALKGAWFLMTVFLILGSRDSWADCGDYVIIGNKARLRELKAAGYDVGDRMKEHRQEEAAEGSVGKESGIPSEPRGPFIPEWIPENGLSKATTPPAQRLPSRPCSGSLCRKNRSRPSSEPCPALNWQSAEPGLLQADRESRYPENSTRSNPCPGETPRTLSFLLDLPPE
ncbi:MAG: hypothetical protein VX768_16350 [Planctomycetota bacterium]|nr:hypothetical protein [Planctomycetota bacterium]